MSQDPTDREVAICDAFGIRPENRQEFMAVLDESLRPKTPLGEVSWHLECQLLHLIEGIEDHADYLDATGQTLLQVREAMGNMAAAAGVALLAPPDWMADHWAMEPRPEVCDEWLNWVAAQEAHTPLGEHHRLLELDLFDLIAIWLREGRDGKDTAQLRELVLDILFDPTWIEQLMDEFMDDATEDERAEYLVFRTAVYAATEVPEDC